MQNLSWDTIQLIKGCYLLAGYACKYFEELIKSDEFETGDFGQWEILLAAIEAVPASVTRPKALAVREEIITQVKKALAIFSNLYNGYDVSLDHDLYDFDEYVYEDQIDDARIAVNLAADTLIALSREIESQLFHLRAILQEQPVPVPCARRIPCAAPVVKHEPEKVAAATQALQMLAFRESLKQLKGE